MSMCVWDDCDQEAVYCPGHAREYMAPDVDALKAENKRLKAALREYGQHRLDCLFNDANRKHRGHKDFVCRCGFAEATHPQTEAKP